MITESYGPWLLKHEMWRVMAQSSRRFGMGVPTVSAPAGSPPADVTTAAMIASGYRAGDQSGIGLPGFYSLAALPYKTYCTPTSSGAQALPARGR
jgi:hypothetical protein